MKDVRAGLALAIALALIYSGPAPVARSQVTQSQGIKELANEITRLAIAAQKSRVAILSFRELNGQCTVLGTFLAEELTTQLFGQSKLDIVERTMLDKVMTELKLGATGAIDASTAKQVGKLAGVDAILVGSITDLQSSVALNARFVDVQTGRVFAAAQTRLVKDDDLKRILGVPCGEAGTKSVTPAVSPSTSSTGSQANEQTSDGFKFQLRSCVARTGGAVCDLVVTQLQEDTQAHVGFTGRIVGQNGQEIDVSRRLIGGNASGATYRFVRNVTTALRLEFMPRSYGTSFGTGRTATTANAPVEGPLQLLEVGYVIYPGGGGMGREGRVQFRGVAVDR